MPAHFMLIGFLANAPQMKALQHLNNAAGLIPDTASTTIKCKALNQNMNRIFNTAEILLCETMKW